MPRPHPPPERHKQRPGERAPARGGRNRSVAKAEASVPRNGRSKRSPANTPPTGAVAIAARAGTAVDALPNKAVGPDLFSVDSATPSLLPITLVSYRDPVFSLTQCLPHGIAAARTIRSSSPGIGARRLRVTRADDGRRRF